MQSKPAKTQSSGVAGFVQEWASTILLLIFGTTTILQAYVVPTSSMESTILIGDHLFVDKLCYSPSGSISKYLLPYQDVKRGDVIVFRVPINIRENYVKRVIGVPGDHIKIVNKKVILNGKPIEEPYTQFLRGNLVQPYADNFPPPPNEWAYHQALTMLRNHVQGDELVVPADHYFAMGDNRDNSSDSRFWGFVPRENIIGKPLFIYWSYETTTERLTGSVDPEHLYDLATNFISKTRWNRMFHFIQPYPILN
jgi:signal peptidase I